MICLLCILLCYFPTIALDNEHLDENHLLCTFELTCFPFYFFLGVLPRITEYDFEVHVYKRRICVFAKLPQSCPALCDPTDHSPPDSSVHGILQERILEWLAIPSSRGSSQSRDQTYISYVSCIDRWILYHQSHLLVVQLISCVRLFGTSWTAAYQASLSFTIS